MEKAMTTDDIIKKIIARIKPQWKAAFWGCFLIGIFTYMYFMTGNFLTLDSMWNLYSDQDMITSGRQFLTYACGISSFYNLPWINGVLAILFLALSSVVVVDSFDIESRVGAVLVGGLLVTFPAVASTFCYMYTVDGYMLAVLLAAVAFWVTDKKKNGYLAGIILLGISIGIYQAYLSFTIILCILRLLIDLVEKDSIKEIWYKIWRYVVMGIGSYIFYVITLKLMLKLKDVEMSGYQGTDRIGSFAIGELPAGLIEAVKSFGRFALPSNRVLYGVGFSNYSVLIIAVLTVILFLIFFIQNKRYQNIWRIVFAIVLVCTIPIGMNIVNVLSPHTFFHLLMRYPWVLFFVFTIVLVEKMPVTDKRWRAFLQKGLVLVTLVTTIGLIFWFGVRANIVAFNMNEKYEKTYAMCVRMVDRIEQTEGYTTDTKIAVLGGGLSEWNYPSTDITQHDLTGYWGVYGTMCISDTGSFQEFAKHYLNVTLNTASATEHVEIAQTEAFMQMPNFPAEGSVGFIEDVLVIKWNG